jgi:hypothetical protein
VGATGDKNFLYMLATAAVGNIIELTLMKVFDEGEVVNLNVAIVIKTCGYRLRKANEKHNKQKSGPLTERKRALLGFHALLRKVRNSPS